MRFANPFLPQLDKGNVIIAGFCEWPCALRAEARYPRRSQRALQRGGMVTRFSLCVGRLDAALTRYFFLRRLNIFSYLTLYLGKEIVFGARYAWSGIGFTPYFFA
ncbi:hypothetical protein bAD24_III08830 [Burkholderia sp. AD24]|nr:hypothetical protein bAD24_III08830 [Burkholderia sp. AD24]